MKGGSIGQTGEEKVTRLRSMALKGRRVPIVWLIDSGGARIDPGSSHPDMISLFAGSGHLFREQVTMSGVVPQVAAMVGPGAAGTAYIPGLADYVPMVKGVGSLALGGPPLVKAVTGQDITEQELGGSKVHCEVSGVGDGEFDDDAACIGAVKKYLSYLPANCDEEPPVVASTDPVDRRDEALLDLLPESTRKPYDMYKLVRAVVDDGDLFDIKPRFARSIITCFARLGGRPIGVVANQPNHLGGILDNDSADKAAHFIQICDAFNVPLGAMLLPGRPGLHGGLQGGARGDHPARGEDAPRHVRGDRAQAHRRGAKSLRRRVLRHVRPRLRAGPSGELAHGRDQRHGCGGHGGHRGKEALRRRRAPARGEEERPSPR